MPLVPSPDFRQHLTVDTPEHVTLDYEIAGVGSRAAAALADWLIVAVLVVVIFFAGILLMGGAVRAGFGGGSVRGWFIAFIILVTYAIVWGYFTLFEGLRDGQTPGKRWLGIRAIRDTGHGLTIAEAAARNLLLPIDMMGMIGIVLIALHPRGKRLGDFVAGTIVVRDRPAEASSIAPVPPSGMAADPDPGTPRLDDIEFQLLREFAARASALPPAVRDRFANQLAARFAARHPDRPAGDLEFVLQLHADELSRRRGRFGGRVGGAGSVAERLVARKSDRWQEFQAIAERVARSGLDTLSAAELPDFAARYREIAADLARARTYRADRLVLAQLERLVTAGHTALYRDKPQTWWRIWHFLSRECPGAVLQSWRYVLISSLVFLVPAGAGYALLRERPALAAELIPDTMLERAEAGASRSRERLGYVLTPADDRPAMATAIMTNNIRVAFICFAGGVVLGVGSLVAVGFNGLELGAISGYFANVGMLGYLWTFVAGHGVLEISAICIAGAAGLMLGLAIIAPGRLPRADALALAGQRAMRLIGMVVVMLVIAGTIEGFVSSSGMSVRGRVMISVGSAVFLAAYLYNGRIAMRREKAP
jgi:uncharacterized membrane protein SpoIIM required for sporulation/uncharacterized RDD family membrane protein YckC